MVSDMCTDVLVSTDIAASIFGGIRGISDTCIVNNLVFCSIHFLFCIFNLPSREEGSYRTTEDTFHLDVNDYCSGTHMHKLL